MKRQEHLSDAEIEQCANNIPGACAEQIESHLSECELCLHRLLEQQRIQFKSIETDGMNRDPHPECYSDNEIQNVAAGMVEPKAAALVLQHAAQCDHCGPLLNQYFEIFSEESSPEIEALIDQLPSSKPGWEKKKAMRLRPECVLLLCRRGGRWCCVPHSGDSRRSCVSGHSYVHLRARFA